MSELIVSTITTDQPDQNIAIDRPVNINGSLAISDTLTVKNIEKVAGNDSLNSDIVTINRDTNEIESISIYSLNPPGSIIPFAGTVDIDYENTYRWLLCDGRFLLIPSETSDRYYKLYQAIGTQWGVNDTGTEFRIPDFRGRFIRGFDNSKGNDPDATDRRKLDADGVIGEEIVGDVIGSYQEDAFQNHIFYNGMADDQTRSFVYGGTTNEIPGNATNSFVNEDTPRLYQGKTSEPKSISSDDEVRITSETRPKNAAVNFIIKY